jgi:hypothetical protein
MHQKLDYRHTHVEATISSHFSNLALNESQQSLQHNTKDIMRALCTYCGVSQFVFFWVGITKNSA